MRTCTNYLLVKPILNMLHQNVIGMNSNNKHNRLSNSFTKKMVGNIDQRGSKQVFCILYYILSSAADY